MSLSALPVDCLSKAIAVLFSLLHLLPKITICSQYFETLFSACELIKLWFSHPIISTFPPNFWFPANMVHICLKNVYNQIRVSGTSHTLILKVILLGFSQLWPMGQNHFPSGFWKWNFPGTQTVCGGSCAEVAELSSCARGPMGAQSQNYLPFGFLQKKLTDPY